MVRWETGGGGGGAASNMALWSIQEYHGNTYVTSGPTTDKQTKQVFEYVWEKCFFFFCGELENLNFGKSLKSESPPVCPPPHDFVGLLSAPSRLSYVQ